MGMRADRKRGYTLIELLVVLVIVGILAALGAAYRQDRFGPAVEGTLQELGGFLANARDTARSSGVRVVLTPSGSGKTYLINYSIVNGPSGAYDHSSQAMVNNYCVVVTDSSKEPAASALNDLKTDLVSRKINTASGLIFSAGMWTNNLASSGFAFNTNGSLSTEGYMIVASTKETTNAPVGIILVGASGNLLRYYRSNDTSNWVRK